MTINQRFSVDYSYKIIFTKDLFDRDNKALIGILEAEKENNVRATCYVDSGVVETHPQLLDKIGQYFDHWHLLTLNSSPLIVPGGEEVKNNFTSLLDTLQHMDDAHLDRHSFVIVVGGGAVLDMVGFAASIAHRGIRLIRVPTTTLSQNDSGVGVKNGINYFGKKNFLGTFTVPYAVINDFLFLETLEDRDWRAGAAEAVKVALIKDSHFFEWLENCAGEIADRNMALMEQLIVRCAELHAHHISQNNDPFESGSSRPLDFGHWAAHKIEQLSQYDIKHGEAVAIGIALDVAYAAEAKFISRTTADRILGVLLQFGFRLFHPLILNESETRVSNHLLNGLEEFREHLGGQLTIPMISGIGKKFDVHQMNAELLSQAALYLQKKEYKHVSP